MTKRDGTGDFSKRGEISSLLKKTYHSDILGWQGKDWRDLVKKIKQKKYSSAVKKKKKQNTYLDLSKAKFLDLSSRLPLEIKEYLIDCTKRGNLDEEARINAYYFGKYYKGWKWPVTSGYPSGVTSKTSEARELSLLKFLGYGVGHSNELTSVVRHRLLDLIFRIYIPLDASPHFTKEYILSWGPPESSPRLKKMVEVIEYARRLKNQNYNSDGIRALAEWSEDLLYLKKTYYEPLKFHSKWYYPSDWQVKAS